MTPFGGTPIARHIVVQPGIQFKAIERNALFPDGDGCDKGPDLRAEAVAVHAEVGGGHRADG